MKIILIVVSIGIFALAAFGVKSSEHLQLVPLGLAVFAASFLPISG